MSRKLKTLWLNLGFLDREMDLSERWQILQALAKEDVEVRASFNYINKPLPIDGIDKVWMLQLRRRGLFGAIKLFAEQQLLLLKNLDVDVVVVWPFNFHQTLPIWFLWRKILRRPLPRFVLDFRTLAVDLPAGWTGKLRQKRFDTSARLAFRYFDGVTIITDKMKSDLQKEVNDFQKLLCVWSTGVDPDLFDPHRAGSLKSELGFNGRFVIMYHGVLSPNRGLQQTIDAIDMVRKSHPEVMLFLLGRGPAETELKQQIQQLGVQDSVRIHPSVPFEDVPKYINSAQVGILPFPDLDWWNTSSPIKLNEYLAMEKPVIVTDIVAHRAVLGKAKCAFFVSDHNPTSLARGIEVALEKAPDFLSLGTSGREIALSRFTWKKQALEIKAYFHNLVCPDSSSINSTLEEK